MTTKWEVRLGSVIAAAGVVWTAKIVSSDWTGIDAFSFTHLPRGPMEICAVGVLVWLHAKWKHSITVR